MSRQRRRQLRESKCRALALGRSLSGTQKRNRERLPVFLSIFKQTSRGFLSVEPLFAEWFCIVIHRGKCSFPHAHTSVTRGRERVPQGTHLAGRSPCVGAQPERCSLQRRVPSVRVVPWQERFESNVLFGENVIAGGGEGAG